jgi:hypothetical protein
VRKPACLYTFTPWIKELTFRCASGPSLRPGGVSGQISPRKEIVGKQHLRNAPPCHWPHSSGRLRSRDLAGAGPCLECRHASAHLETTHHGSGAEERRSKAPKSCATGEIVLHNDANGHGRAKGQVARSGHIKRSSANREEESLPELFLAPSAPFLQVELSPCLLGDLGVSSESLPTVTGFAVPGGCVSNIPRYTEPNRCQRTGYNAVPRPAVARSAPKDARARLTWRNSSLSCLRLLGPMSWALGSRHPRDAHHQQKMRPSSGMAADVRPESP